MDRAELMKEDLRKRITQIEYIRHKLQHISRFYEFPNLKLFDHKLEKVKKSFEDAFTPTGWYPYISITNNESLTNAILLGRRLEIFVYEVRFERLAIAYDSGFFGFYHPEPFKLFGLNEELVYNNGLHGGVRIPAYDEVRLAIRRDPSLILREREKVTAYIYKGSETSVFRRNGGKFPIDLTIPGGY